MSNGAWQKFKNSIMTGIDINVAVIVSSIILLPYSIVASFLGGVFTVTGLSGMSLASVVGLISLAIITLTVQLSVLGWTWKWLNRKEWMPSDWMDM